MGSGAKFLALALDVRKLTDSLIQLAEDGTVNTRLYPAIHEVLDSIRDVDQKTSVKALRDRGQFGRYPAVVTMSEVIRSADRQRVVQELCGVLNEQDPLQQKENALSAISFFDALERRALYHSARSHAKRRPSISR